MRLIHVIVACGLWNAGVAKAQITPKAAMPATPAVTPAIAPTIAPTVTPKAIPSAIARGSVSSKDSVKSQDYSLPMYFEISDATLSLPPPEVEYDLSLDKSESLKVGNVVLNEKTFLIALRTVSQLFPQLKGVLKSQELNQKVLILRWPEIFLKKGLLEMISREGKVLWKSEITSKSLSSWKKQVDEWKNQGVIQSGSAENLASSLTNTQLGFVNPKAFDIPLEGQQFFRFCLTEMMDRSQTKLCSRRYGTKGAGSQLVMGKVKNDVKARVFFKMKKRL